MSIHLRACVALLAAAVFLAACGESPSGPGRLPSQPSLEAQRLPVVPPAAKARFALDRLLKGPLPRTAAFGIDKLHLLNMEHARDDLVALPEATRDLLADAGLRERVTNPKVPDRNPWHNLLDVLAKLPAQDPTLVEAWTAPALEVRGDAPLQRRAVDAIVATRSETLAPVLLRFLAAWPADRKLAPDAVGALSAWGSPWRERALRLAYGDGGPRLWSRLPELVGGATSALPPRAADALAWWALLAEGSGPRPARGTGRSLEPPWFPARTILDQSVWPRDRESVVRALGAGRLFAPETVLDAAGYLPGPARATAVRPVPEFLTAGRASAASARCQLAGAEFPPWVHALESDLRGLDPDLRMFAESCPASVDPEDSRADAMVAVETFLDQIEAGRLPPQMGVYPHLRVLFKLEQESASALSWRILRSARPAHEYQQLLEAVHDLLLEHEEAALVAEVSQMAASEDPYEIAFALTLIRRARRLAYAPTVDRLLEHASGPQIRHLRQLLIWLHTTGAETDEASRAAFAARYESWVAEAPDPVAATLAPGLLDLGEAGAAAYVRGLSGERRRVYVGGLLQRSALVGLDVARALLAPVDEATTREERHAVWVALYRTAPTGAAGLLATVRARLPKALEAESDDVLEVLRHRAAR